MFKWHILKHSIIVFFFSITASASGLGAGGSIKSVLPNYDPINDPHLRDYFERKFSLSSAVIILKGRTFLKCALFCVCLQKRYKKPRKLGPNEVIYKVRVKTGSMKYSSTTANVYLSMIGKKGQLRRQHLFNKSGSVCIDKVYKYKFDRGSSNLFRIIGEDIGSLAFIVIEVFIA